MVASLLCGQFAWRPVYGSQLSMFVIICLCAVNLCVCCCVQFLKAVCVPHSLEKTPLLRMNLADNHHIAVKFYHCTLY